jgi:branched-chain amino acid transport system substrate-binding protein
VLATGGIRAVAQDRRPIRIGFSIAQTGTLAAGGKAALIARQMWREDVNARGGILGRPVDLVFYDDQTNGSNAPGIYTKLLDVDKVDILFGPYGTPVQAPILPLVKERNLLLFGNFSYLANEKFRYDMYFHAAPFGSTPDAWPGAFVSLAARNGVKTLAILSADSEGTQTLAAGAREVAAKMGMKVVYDQKYPFNSVDFSSVLRSIRAARPDAVYVASFPNETAAIVRGVGEVGVGDSVKLFGGGMVGLQFAPLLENLGPAVNGIVNFHTYVPEKTMDFPGIRDFLTRYSVKAKEAQVDPLGFYLAPFNYAMGQVMEQAIGATRTLDNRVLAKYMKENEFNTVVGKIRFGPTGEWLSPRMVQVQYQGVTDKNIEQFRSPGKTVIVEPPEYVSGELRMPFEKSRR